MPDDECPVCYPEPCSDPDGHPRNLVFEEWAEGSTFPSPALDRYVVADRRVVESVTEPFRTKFVRAYPGQKLPVDEARRLGLTGPVLLGPNGVPEEPDEPESQPRPAPVETQDVPPPIRRDPIVERGPFVQTQDVKGPRRGKRR